MSTATYQRKIVQIDADKCNGCGLCVDACHEGAIQMVDGKAKLVSDIYCDGLGDCLGPCPTGAISIITREADAYDQKAVDKHLETLNRKKQMSGGCPGSASRSLKEKPAGDAAEAPLPCGCPGSQSRELKSAGKSACECEEKGAASNEAVRSELMNWPVKLDLIPPRAPYLYGAELILAADCVPVATPDFHSKYLRRGPVAIACPKLNENEPQIEKLKSIIQASTPASITVLRMEVPCCGGLVRVAEEAIRRSGVEVPLHVEVVAVDGGTAG